MTSSRVHATPRLQQGITTLAVTLILLVIVTMMVLFSTSIGFFEQKTATNEDRSRVSQQAAEYALNLAGEYLKANRDQILSDDSAESGWMAPSSNAHWAKCADVTSMPATHPCMSEPDATRRAQLYFYTQDGTTGTSTDLPYKNAMPAAARVEAGMGGTSNFTAQATVRALLCRLDTSDPTNVDCKLNPVAGNRVALTLIADASLTNESGAKASIKETWATYAPFVPSASVPLIASGFVQGLGNGQIVANPDSGSNGSNVMASVWSPNNVSVDGSGGGVGSFITCQYSEFTGQLLGLPEMSMHDVKENCPSATGNSPPCNCPKAPDPNRTMKEDWSGHGTGGGSTLHKGNDILDVASGSETVCDSTVNTITNGCRTLPSITFFPGPNGSGSPMDHAGVLDDDSIFEYIFNVDYVAADRSTDAHTLTNCGSSGTQNCVDYAMREQFSATVVSNCSSLDSNSTGIIWVTNPCSQLNTQIGTPDNPVIVVINQGGNSISLKNGLVMYGMLFLHSDNPISAPVQVGGTNAQVYGSLVVEGDIKMTGNFTIVYDSTAASSSKKIPSNAKFALVPGSWLDAKTAF